MKKERFLSVLFFSFFLCILSIDIYSQSKTELPKWVIGASPLKNINAEGSEGFSSASVEAASVQIPQLILGKVTEGMERILVESENFQRNQYALLVDRQKLFSELSKLVLKRDSILFSKGSEDEKQKELEDAELKISEQKEKILENFEEEKELTLELQNNLDKEKNKSNTNKNFFANLFSKDTKENIEALSIWKNDITKLFTFDEVYDDVKVYEQELQKAVIRDGINGLMTGTIKSIGEFISVTMELRQYPGGELYATANDVGVISELDVLADSLSRQLLPSLINTEPVKIDVLILPEEVATQSVLYIGDEVYKGSRSEFIVQPGIRDFRIETPGYKSVNINYNFSGQTKFFVTVHLQEELNFTLNLSVNQEDDVSVGQDDISFNINALPLGKDKSNISVNGKKYFGEIIVGDISTFFIIDSNEIDSNASLNIKSPSEKLSDRIDKSRKRLYRSYGYVLLSLPVYYTFAGMYETRQNASSSQVKHYTKDLSTYEILNYCGVGLLATAGVNMVVQLIRYLIDANKVLPQTYSSKDFGEYVEPEIIEVDESVQLDERVQVDESVQLDENINEEIKTIEVNENGI